MLRAAALPATRICELGRRLRVFAGVCIHHLHMDVFAAGDRFKCGH